MEPTEKVTLDSSRASTNTQVSLLFTWGDRAFAITIGENQSCVVGRTDAAEIVIDDPSLSRAHARLSLCNGQVTLEDLGSTNGCLLNGVRVSCASIQGQDSVQLGAVELRICASRSQSEDPDQISHTAFMRATSDELARARLVGRGFSVLALKHDGSPELEEVLRVALRPLDRWCSIAPSIALILLPEQDSTAARAWVQRALGPGRLEHCGGVASYPALVGTAERLVSAALDACRAAPPGQVRESLVPDPASVSVPVVLSPVMLALYDLVVRAARTTLPILIQGETGSGKELVARAIHEKSPRHGAPFKALNCATIPVALIESVLFGHERGAFTGAERQTAGVFEQAAGGTVFLDEIGELSAQAQAALLRVVEHRRVTRLGGTRDVEVDVRIVAATHRNLRAMAKNGAFRPDLLFRLDGLTLQVPPLRARPEEILPLAERFLADARARWAAPALRMSEDVCEALQAYAWPGNVRQLRNVMEYAAVVGRNETIQLDDLPAEVWRDLGESTPDAATGSQLPTLAGADGARSLPDRVRAFELSLIRDALDKAEGNQAQAARILGVPRRTLASKLQVYGLLPSRA